MRDHAAPPRGRPAELLWLLHQQPAARRSLIAQRWGAPSAEPAALYRHIIHDRDAFERVLLQERWVGTTQQILVDMVQDFSLPVTLYPDDREARHTLSEWGFIFPCPAEWGVDDPRYPNWSWVLPAEIAILCARIVPIFRPRLLLMLGHMEDDALATLAEHLDVRLASTHPESAQAIAQRLTEPGFLEHLLLDGEWYDHLFTLQIVFEWHGLCHRQELFSFAWGDDTIRPLTARDQRLREQSVERDLLGYGLLYAYTPPAHDPYGAQTFVDKQGLVEEDELSGGAVQLVLLPEELRLDIWTLCLQMQELALREGLEHLGGWALEHPERGQPPQEEPVDRLKGLVCVLDAQLPLAWSPDEAAALLQRLPVALEPQGEAWAPLFHLGLLGGVLVEQPLQGGVRLAIGRNASQLLDEGAAAWCRTALDLWVRGRGAAPLDHAQNMFFGLSAEWLAEVAALIQTPVRRTPPMIPWWEHAQNPAHAPALSDDERDAEDGPPVVRARRKQRPMPSWLHASGAGASGEVWCGNPRTDADRPALQRELFILEGVITTFRLLLLDVLRGLPTHRDLPITELGIITQDTAALALHLNLAALLLDPSGQTFIPVRPPTFLIEPSMDAPAEEFARALLEWLLVPAGAAELREDRESFRLIPGRLVVDTPPWFDDGARRRVLASLTGEPEERLRSHVQAAAPRHLRQVATVQVESERRFWLGRPLEELRRAAAGQRITALRAGYMELG